MTAGFGGQPYVQQESRALSSISETPGPDLSQGQEAFLRMLQGHDHEIRFLADEMKKTQKGVNEANQNPIQQIQQFIADVIVLLGGGELAEGALDFGDLQYILPALGALFGFGDGPFPVSLFMAAERFFLGYVVPQQQFVDVINGIIQAWLGTLGIDPKFIKDVKDLITAIGDLFDGINNLFPSVDQLFSALGISSGDLGPFGQVLGPIMKLFTGFDLSSFGDIVEFITDAIGPFIEQLTAVINFINSVLAVLGFDGPGGVVNSPIGDVTNPFTNLVGLLGSLNFADSGFDVFDSWSTIITSVINPSGGLFSGSLIPGLDASKIVTGLFSQSQVANLATMLGGFGTGSSIISQLLGLIPNLSGGTTGLSGLGDVFTDLFSLLGTPTNVGTGGTLTLPGVSAIPVLSGLLNGGGTSLLTSLIPGIDASKITSGTFGDALVPIVGNLRDAIYQAAHGGSTTGTTAAQAKTALTDIFASALTAFQPSATPSNVALTDAITLGGAIKSAVTAGYTVSIFAASNAAWTIPTGTTEAIGIVVNGGNRGQTGATAFNAPALGGLGGLDGGYLSAPLDLTGLVPGTDTLNITVGAAAASPGGTGGVSSITATTGTLLAGAAGANGIYSTKGLLLSTSQPGAGGNGGDANGPVPSAQPGGVGGASGLGGAGTAGTARTTNSAGTAGPGGNGGAGQSSGLPVVGGGGGGGGGGCAVTGSFSITGGAGGNGGYPGGGSGGGGAASTNTAFGTRTGGAPGTPGNGIVVVIHK